MFQTVKYVFNKMLVIDASLDILLETQAEAIFVIYALQ
jgi:hypothetical protein